MTIGEQDRERLETFLAAAPALSMLQRPGATISYVATRQGADFIVVGATMRLSSLENPRHDATFLGTTVRAGRFQLSELGIGAAEFLEAAVQTSQFKIPGGELKFLPGDSGQYGCGLMALSPQGLQMGKRVGILTIHGATVHGRVSQPELDWELKAAEQPYEDLNEFTASFDIEPIQGHTIAFNVMSLPVVEIDPAMTVEDGRAVIGLTMLGGLPQDRMSLGIRVLQNGKVTERRSVATWDILWRQDARCLRGTASIPADRGAVIHAVAVYAGVAQHERLLVDGAASQNSQRVVFEAFDPNLAMLRQFLGSGGERRDNARKVEPAIAWLSSLLGFQVMHLGGVEQTQDAVDVVASTPAGHVALIECTTGILKTDKVGNLLARAEMVRQSLRGAGSTAAKVIPVMVTTMPRSHVQPGVEAAVSAGVLVICQEDIERQLRQTVLKPDAEALYSRAEAWLARAQGRSDETHWLQLPDLS